MPSDDLNSLNRDLENELKQKASKCNQLKIAKELLEEKLEKAEEKCRKAEDSKLNIETELEEKYLECHELKISNEKLQEKLKKAAAESTECSRTVKEDKEKHDEKIEFLVISVKRSTEETLSMERKLTDAKK